MLGTTQAEPGYNGEVTAKTSGEPHAVSADAAVHRIGGARVENLRLKPQERILEPPGISVLLGGTPREAAERVQQAFPHAAGLQRAARIVGSATAASIRRASFDVIALPTRHLPSHGRLTHPRGAAGFSDANLEVLSRVFRETITS
jgi:hypothetical protein